MSKKVLKSLDGRLRNVVKHPARTVYYDRPRNIITTFQEMTRLTAKRKLTDFQVVVVGRMLVQSIIAMADPKDREAIRADFRLAVEEGPDFVAARTYTKLAAEITLKLALHGHEGKR